MTYEADYKTFTTNFPDHHAAFDWMEIFEAFFLNSKLRGVHADTAMVSGLRRAARTGRVRAADNRAGRPRLRGAQGAPAMSCASAHDLFESTPHGPDYVIAGAASEG
jgi:hypothetical protein